MFAASYSHESNGRVSYLNGLQTVSIYWKQMQVASARPGDDAAGDGKKQRIRSMVTIRTATWTRDERLPTQD